MNVEDEEIELSGDVDAEVTGVESDGIWSDRKVHLSRTIPWHLPDVPARPPDLALPFPVSFGSSNR